MIDNQCFNYYKKFITIVNIQFNPQRWNLMVLYSYCAYKIT
ncbi:hypothetical protein KCTC52924_03902 [Arenibacter antarcticus]